MLDVQKKIKKVLANHPYIGLAILFGSRAVGRESLSSDIDIAVAAKSSLSKNQKMDLIDDLAQSMGYPVDLIDLTAVSGTILQQALCTGIILIKKQPALYAKLILKMWYNQADFMPAFNMAQKKRVEAFAYG
jgi:predicted nucleotidyltransferase